MVTQDLIRLQIFADTALADLHWQMPGARPPPKGPDSFILTYKIFEM